MYAFATFTPVGHSSGMLTQPMFTTRCNSSLKIRPQRIASLRACADSQFDPAVKSGQELRQKLQDIAEDRQDRADRTAASLEKMSQQLNQIMTKLRAEAGMPPVADPPVTSNDSKSTNNTSMPVLTPDVSSLDDDASSNSDEPYMDPKMFGYDSTAGWQVLAESDSLPENEGNVEFRIECDMHGCSLIEVKGDTAEPGPGVRQRFIQSGANFRVGYDPEAPKGFCAMIGSDHWLLALSYDEIRHFKRLCLSLQKKMDRIGRGEEDPPVKKPALRRSGDGMFNMRVAKAGVDCSIELESKLVWVQAIGQPVQGQYCIRAIFMESRQSEGFWGADTVPNLLSALNKLGIE